jgi:ABC-type polysaccharide/polyol phosphate export permease
MAGMALGLVGGCAFPANQLPAFLREHVTTLMPSYWFVDTARNLQFGGADVAWGLVTLKLVLLSVVLLALAAVLFRRKFKMGLRA